MNFNQLYKKIADLDEAFRRRNPDEDEEDFGHESDFEHDRRKDDERDRKREEQAAKEKTVRKETNEGVDARRVRELADKLESGEISYEEFRDALDRDEYTDYSMRQGEMGNPDARDGYNWNRGGGERDEWDKEDQYERDAAADDENEWERQDRLEREREDDEPRDRYGFDESLDEYTMESIRRATKSTSLLKECGDDMMPAAGAAKSVTMNVTMNASSGEGIRELLGVLSNFESSTAESEPMEMPMVMSTTSGHSLDKGPVGADDSMDDTGEADTGDFEEDYANSPDKDYGTVDDVINPPSNDLNSPHQSYKNNPLGGDNKMAESIAQKLLAQYKLKQNN